MKSEKYKYFLLDIKNAIDILVNFIFKISKRIFNRYKTNSVLVVRLDAIGDYILFRNFLTELRNDAAFRNKKITLLGNPVFKEIAEKLDCNVINNFIWVNPDILIDQELSKTKLKIKLKLRIANYDILIHPVHSRKWEIDNFLFSIGLKYTITSSGDASNYDSVNQLHEANKLYNRIIEVETLGVFEFFRNKFFFEGLLNKNLQTQLSIDPIARTETKSNYIVIFPGGHAEYRKWETKQFASFIDQLTEKYNGKYVFKIAGAFYEKIIVDEIISYSKNKNLIESLVGRTTLLDLIRLIDGALLLISNETSAVHMAAALKSKAVCISNGNHFGRFNPYPNEISDTIITLYPNNDFYKKELYQKLVDENKKQSILNINLITVDRVIASCIELLDTNS